jgi:hypothetical protein
MKTTRFQTLNPSSVDAEKSMIFGVSVITKGVAKGHGLIVDDTTLDQVVSCGNAARNGIKVKVGHDSGVEEIVGRLTAFRRDGDKVLADLELLATSPRRDFIFEIATKTPEAVGLSISFEGKPESVNGTDAARCKRLRSVDFVDEPAANPDGLFESSVDETTNCEEQMKTEDKPTEKMAEGPSVEERLGALESALAEIKTMLASLVGEEKTESESEAEMKAGADFEAVETKILNAVETKFEALTTLIKSFGPVAPGVNAEQVNTNVSDFTELRKNNDAMRKYLIAKGVLKA